jgi:hypothetical protein
VRICYGSDATYATLAPQNATFLGSDTPSSKATVSTDHPARGGLRGVDNSATVVPYNGSSFLMKVVSRKVHELVELVVGMDDSKSRGAGGRGGSATYLPRF